MLYNWHEFLFVAAETVIAVSCVCDVKARAVRAA